MITKQQAPFIDSDRRNLRAHRAARPNQFKEL